MSGNTGEKKKGEYKTKARISSDDLFNRQKKFESTISSSDLNRITNKIRTGNDKTINSSELNKKSKKK